MTESAHDHEHAKNNSLDRLLFFSDGVFAIAITLLAIELHKPETWNGRAADLWAHGWPMYASFLLSFLVVGVLWNAHRRLFTLINRFSEWVFFLNLATLCAVALMPFATTLLYAGVAGNEGFIVYLSLVALTGVTQALTYGAAVLIGDVRPVHPMRRLAAFLTFLLTPALSSSLSMFLFSRLWTMSAFLAVVLILLNLFRRWTMKRFPG